MMLDSDGHIQREKQTRILPKISAYLQGLHLLGKVKEWVRDNHFKAPPQKKRRPHTRIPFGTDAVDGVWGNLHLNDTPSQSTPIIYPPSIPQQNYIANTILIDLTGPTRKNTPTINKEESS